MNLSETMAALSEMGTETCRKIYRNHGAPENTHGVKVGDLKTLVKKIKKNHPLALELYATGNSDAQYLAGLIAEPAQFAQADLDRWAQESTWYMVSEYTVAWMASESGLGWELAERWIASPEEKIAASGWATLSCLLGLVADDRLPLDRLRERIEHVANDIHRAPNRVRYTMNGFVLAAGIFTVPLHEQALAASQRIGKVKVDMGGTACKVPFGPEYIPHSVSRAGLGKKRKTFVC
jgi:3-methyladenine DNA glycosylase AlkD